MGTHSAPRLRAVLALTGSLALAATLLAATPASAASLTACRVKNLDTGVTKASLQKAHDAARQGHRLTIRGVCAGPTTIRKSLVITGIRTKSSGKPILDGKLSGSVVTVRGAFGSTVKVTMKNLTVRYGLADFGGGIQNDGTLVLRDVVVRANTATDSAGGIYNNSGGTLTLNGSSSIRANVAGYGGGGIASISTVTLNGSSSIHGNSAGSAGGGVLNWQRLVLNGSSSIRGNSAGISGGGVANAGSLVLNGSSSIRNNSPDDVLEGPPPLPA